jgi:hypothetical protein
MHTSHAFGIVLVGLCFGLGSAGARTAGPAEMPIEDYLGLLRQIAPAAETGARTWLAAHATRCRRRLGSTALRQAISEASGDPTLMAMIRAAQVQDMQALQRLAAGLPCRTEVAR